MTVQPGAPTTDRNKTSRVARHAGVWLYRAHRVLQLLSGGRAGLHVYLFYAQPMKSSALTGVRDDTGTRVVPVTESSALLPLFPRPAAVLAQRFSTGATCFAVLVKDQFAGHIWLAKTRYDEDEVRCRYVLPNATAVWDFDVYVAPQFRATRAMARLWKRVSQLMEDDQVHWSYSRISIANTASIQAHERMGAQHLCSGAFLALGRLQLALLPKPWRLHLSLPGAAAPVLHLADPEVALATGRGAAAVVLGLDSHGLAVARALADAGVTVYAFEPDMSRPGVRSNRVRRVFHLQSFDAVHLVPALVDARRLLSQHTKVALLAINDRHVKVIAEHLVDLQPSYSIAWAEKARDILHLQDKTALQAICERQGLLYPRSITLFEIADHGRVKGMRYPLIIKPSRPLSSFKTLLAKDASELQAHLRKHSDAFPILCQEYIAGGDHRLYFGALMLDRGRVVGAMAGRKIASHPVGLGQTTIAETVEAPEVLRLTEQFFAGFELSGPVSLELKQDDAGHYWVIEPTVGRTDFWVELCIRAGFNLPLDEVRLATGLKAAAPNALFRTVWYDSERDPLAYPWLWWSRLWQKHPPQKHAFPYFGHADIKPFARSLVLLLRSKLQLFRRKP